MPYGGPFPQFATSITDNFNRADQNPISSPWVETADFGGLYAAIVSNQFTNAAAGPPGSGGANYGTTTYDAFEAIVTINAIAASSEIELGIVDLFPPNLAFVAVRSSSIAFMLAPMCSANSAAPSSASCETARTWPVAWIR